MRKHGVWTLCALAVACLLPGLSGCQPARVPRTLSKFDAKIVPGILTHDIVLTNQNLRSLKQIDLTVTVYFETKVETRVRHGPTGSRTSHKRSTSRPAAASSGSRSKERLLRAMKKSRCSSAPTGCGSTNRPPPASWPSNSQPQAKEELLS